MVTTWTGDALVRLVHETGASLRGGRATVDIPPAHESLTGYRDDYENIRLVFDVPPPPDLAVRLEDASGAAVEIPPERVRRARAQFPRTAGPFVDLLVDPVVGDHMRADGSTTFSLLQLRRVTVSARSCAAAGPTLARIERDAFSRRTALLTLPALQRWNVRPVYLAAHGGYTMAMDPGDPVPHTLSPPTPGTYWADPAVQRTIEVQATQPDRPAYHADLLRLLGVEATHEIKSRRADECSIHFPSPARVFAGERFHLVGRSDLAQQVDWTSAHAFVASVLAIEPTLDRARVEAQWVAGPAHVGATQGAFAGGLIELALAGVARGRSVECVWYTHMGSLPFVERWKGTLDRDRPLPLAIEESFRRLGRRHYGAGADLRPADRVWVPATSTWVRYRLVRDQLEGRVSVDGSRVEVRSWIAPVTSVTVPDPAAGTRDLHGVTVHVADPAQAEATVDGRPVHTFTRNPPDAAGRASITFVDDHVPAVLVGRVPLEHRGAVEVEGARVEHRRWGCP